MKSIWGAALGSLLAFGASAQSSLTVFGILDVGLTYGQASTANRTQLSSGNTLPSRLGFRGVEDLGGGLAASFWLEGQLSLNSGTGGSTNTNNQTSGAVPAGGFNFGRRSTVSLSSDWGELRLGRDLTLQSLNTVIYDPYTNVGVGASLPFVMSLGGPTFLRASNAVTYFSPRLMGAVSLQAQTYFGNNASGVANSRDGSGSSARAVYDADSFSAALAWSKTHYVTGDITTTNIGGHYQTGPIKWLFTWNKDHVEGAQPSGRGGLLGMSYRVGKGEIKATWSEYQTSAALNPKADKWALGYVHDLSKRTLLYATVAQLKNSGGSSQALGGAIASPNGRSLGLDLGIRHTF